MHLTIKNHRCASAQLLLTLLIPTLLVACKESDADANAAAPIVAKISTVAFTCGENGFLRTALVGGVEAAVDWSHDEMHCESMMRPQGKGARLRFTGPVGNEQLAIIVALPDLLSAETAKELPSNVTITVEGSGRFFSTPGLASCWTDIEEQQRLSDDPRRYTIAGNLYCIAPLGELNGDAAVSIAELSFRSIIEWRTATPSISN